ncbi:MAG: SCP2 sterol-binding domain-containing protein [Actinobacteria bacterium]|jgi:putative sterol carrier protein|nr:MAG: SCP2 sterol-binding domain-containing protein [Actinomycetota bacterium]
MAYFTSEQEVYDTLGKLFVDMVDDDELFGKFRKSNTIVQYRFHDPDSQITVRMKEDEEPKVDLGATDLQPEVTMTMDADTAHRFWLGQVNVTVALARGQIKAKGPVAKVLRLVPLARPVFPRYEAQLKEQGREDLVEVA